MLPDEPQLSLPGELQQGEWTIINCSLQYSGPSSDIIQSLQIPNLTMAIGGHIFDSYEVPNVRLPDGPLYTVITVVGIVICLHKMGLFQIWPPRYVIMYFNTLALKLNILRCVF